MGRSAAEDLIIPNPGTRLRKVVSFTSRTAYPRQGRPVSLNKKLSGLQKHYERFVKQDYLFLLPGIEKQVLRFATRSLVVA